MKLKSYRKRIETEKKIEVTIKKAEEVLEEQRRLFDEKEAKVEEQRKKYERQRLASQDELHKKALEKQKAIQEVIARDHQQEILRKKEFYDKEARAEQRRQELEREHNIELQLKIQRELERERHIKNVKKQMNKIETNRKRRILTQMNQKEMHLYQTRVERKLSLSQK
jgi:hypothetical protein